MSLNSHPNIDGSHVKAGVAEPPCSAALRKASPYQYASQHLAKPRPLRVIVIGAGISGIATVKMFKEYFHDKPVELVIYEKNADLCGTWLENRYPGVTPGHMYLESLTSDNVTVECGQILKVFDNGIETEDGTKYTVDAIVCATGFDTSFRPAFPVIGLSGEDLREAWKTEPKSYLSVAASGIPNYFIIGGPNFPLANGGLIPCLEKSIDYAFQAIAKIQTQGVASLSPKSEAVDDFQEHKDSLMKDLVWTSGCSSWYKNGTVDGKVWGPWCGSSLHYLELMSNPRWEDWNIQYVTSNRFQYLGIGKTALEENGGDLAYYLKEPGVAVL